MLSFIQATFLFKFTLERFRPSYSIAFSWHIVKIVLLLVLKLDYSMRGGFNLIRAKRIHYRPSACKRGQRLYISLTYFPRTQSVTNSILFVILEINVLLLSEPCTTSTMYINETHAHAYRITCARVFCAYAERCITMYFSGCCWIALQAAN